MRTFEKGSIPDSQIKLRVSYPSPFKPKMVFMRSLRMSGTARVYSRWNVKVPAVNENFISGDKCAGRNKQKSKYQYYELSSFYAMFLRFWCFDICNNITRFN